MTPMLIGTGIWKRKYTMNQFGVEGEGEKVTVGVCVY